MKIPPLSQAILLGATMKPPAFSAGRADRSCALEAAADAIGYVGEHRWCIVKEVWPWTNQRAGRCPVQFFHFWKCRWFSYGIIEQIYHLNDHHHWSRPRIAAWIASIEPRHIATLEPPDPPAPVPMAEEELVKQ